jgi:hypothetical protein
MRAREFIVESARAPLYHGTSIKNAESILQDGMLNWHARGDNTEGQISLTREFNTSLRFAEGAMPAGVVFVLDQTALKQALGRKLQPYDWQQGTGGGSEEQEEAVWDRDVPMNSKTIIEIIVVTNAGWHPSHNSPDDETLSKEFPLVFDYPVKFYRPDQRKIHPRTYRGIYKQSPMSLTSRADFEKELYSVITAYVRKIGTEDFSKYTRKDIENMAKEFGGNDQQAVAKKIAKDIGRSDLIS